jgi:hypothetical protein
MTRSAGGARGWKVRVSERAFRIALLAYPRDFRESFGDEMAQTFRDLLRDAHAHGPWSSGGLWARTIGDIAVSALKERSAEMRRRGYQMICAVALGLAIAWVDSRPHWDDAGITAGMLFLVCALLGAIDPRRAWQWALAVGLWIPLYGLLSRHDPRMVLVLVPPFLGAYLGAGIRSFVFPPTGSA